jgi:predicted transcriptional regulator
MVERGLVEREGEVFLLTDRGTAFLTDLGIAKPPRAGKSCNDWSERRPHVAGKLGVALAKRLFDLDWVRRTERRRAVEVTPEGKRELAARLGV